MIYRVSFDFIPPAVNRMYARGKSSFYKNSRAKQESDAVSWAMKTQFKRSCTNKPVSLSVTFTYADQRKRDIDGSLKSLLDAGNEIIWDDDSQIFELHVFRRYEKEKARTDLTIEIAE